MKPPKQLRPPRRNQHLDPNLDPNATPEDQGIDTSHWGAEEFNAYWAARPNYIARATAYLQQHSFGGGGGGGGAGCSGEM